MNNKLKRELKDFIDNSIGISIYLIDENNQYFTADLKNEDLDESLKQLLKSIKSKYTNNESFTIPYLSNYDERNNALYLFDFDEKPKEFELTEEITKIKANKPIPPYEARDNKLKSLKASVIVIKDRTGRKAAFYQQIYNVTLVSSESGFLNLTTHKTRIVKLNNDVIRLSSNFVFVKFGEQYLIENIKTLENQLDFKDVIHARAENYLEDIINMNFTNNHDIMIEKVKEETAFARKVVKVCKHSAVIEQKIPTEKLIKFVKENEHYSDSFKFNDDETLFNLNSIIRSKRFLDLLDDDFLSSKLTNRDYIAKSKDRVN
ncbi:anti-phage protein KwaB [Shewanella algae]|uniref:anti-phage protein KwaB n=1 Tax=Shewanella algae TaxID=38313 RepID=UPI0031F4844A